MQRGPSFGPHRTALLRTCRQVYIEAVDLLYSGNTFVFNSPAILARFAEAVPPCRLNAIRTLRIFLQYRISPRFPISNVESPLLFYRRRVRQAFHDCWKMIAGMEHLTTLHVNIGYILLEHGESQSSFQEMLIPLLDLRGIRRFTFELELFSTLWDGSKILDVQLEDDIKALINLIEKTVRLPRLPTSVGPNVDDGSLSTPDQTRVGSGQRVEDIRLESSASRNA